MVSNKQSLLLRSKIFVDTSWFKAFIDEKDEFYPAAFIQMEKFIQDNYLLVTTNFIIDESLTLIRIRCGLKTALKFNDLLYEMAGMLKIVRITPKDEEDSWKWFPEDWSKLSFTDCTSFAVMKRLDLKDVATFDQHFARAGFTIFK